MNERSHTNVAFVKMALLATIVKKRHVTSVHEGKKPFKCDICDAKFDEKSKLKKHITSVHEQLKAK